MRGYSDTIPVQYQNRKSRFMAFDLYVDERTFIPRPETELLVDVVLKGIGRSESSYPVILDLCTGSGAVAIALAGALNNCDITAVDISEEALEVAGRNVNLFDPDHKISLLKSDLFNDLPKDKFQFDCIVSNPPYVSTGDYEKVDAWVKAEPPIAFLAGEEGLDCIDKIIRQAADYVVKDGFMALEVGYDQSAKVKAKLSENGFSRTESYRDFNGFERIVAGWKNG